MSGDLAAFLLARIAEDEAAADLVLRPYGDDAATNDAAWWSNEREWFRIGLCSDDTPLLTRMTPQRVLAECEAKRRIVQRCLERWKRERLQAENDHAQALARASGFRRHILEMHGPVFTSGTYPEAECDGCDFGGYDGDKPGFPCRTYEAARDWKDEG